MSVNNRGKKILLVDDDQGLRTVLAEQLDLYDGFTTIQVGTAADRDEVLLQLRSHHRPRA